MTDEDLKETRERLRNWGVVGVQRTILRLSGSCGRYEGVGGSVVRKRA